MASDKGKIDIQTEGIRWNELKSVLNLTDESLATILIDNYLQTDSQTQSNGNRRKRESMRKRKLKKSMKTESFDLSEYGVHFPREERETELDGEPVSAIREVFNLNYGHRIETESSQSLKQSTNQHPVYVTDPCAAARESAYIVHNCCLIQLANQSPPSHCTVRNCGSDVNMVKKLTGTAVCFIWTCSKGHLIREWSSQPSLQGEGHLGDLILTSSIVMSGCNYNQIALLFKLMNLECIDEESYQYLSSSFVEPKILSYWNTEQQEILSALDGRDLIILGCGIKEESVRFPVFCVLDYESGDVLYISILDNQSSNITTDRDKLELQAFIQALQCIENSGGRVVEVVTDIKPKINNYLRKKYPDIKRSYDMWAGVKFIGQAIVQASEKNNCQELLPWLPEIINHFLETSKTCAEISGSLWVSTDEEAFKENFVTGIIHHTVNNHKWLSGECTHEPLVGDEDITWLLPDSPAHNQLKQVLLDKKLSSIIGNFSTNRTSCGVDKLLRYISVYTTDNSTSCSYDEYRVRVYLAVLDYIHHHNLPDTQDEHGNQILEKVYSSYSGQMELQTRQECKSYQYLPGVIEKIVAASLNTN